MKSFLFMPEKCKWRTVKANTAEMAYRCECCWYDSSTRIAVMDMETGETSIFTRELDANGNLIEVKKECV